MRQQAILVTLRICVFSPFFCLILRPSDAHCMAAAVPSLWHCQLHHQQHHSPCSQLAQTVRPSMPSCSTSQECQTHTLSWPRAELAESVCSRGMARQYYVFIYISQASHTCCKQMQAKQASKTWNHNIRIYISSEEKRATQCYWKHLLFPRNVEKYSGSSTISLLQAKVFAFSFAKTLWNSRHKSQNTKTNTSKPVLHSWQRCLLTAAFQVS